MRLPIGDWQFWAVTALFLGALLWMFRGTLPGTKSRRKKRGHRATLTVSGRAVGKRP